MNTLVLSIEDKARRQRRAAVPAGSYAPLEGVTSSSTLLFGDFVRTQTVTHNAALFKKDRDGDGKVGEAAAADKMKKKRGWNKDHDNDGKPNAIDKDYSSTEDESDGEGGKKKKEKGAPA